MAHGSRIERSRKSTRSATTSPTSPAPRAFLRCDEVDIVLFEREPEHDREGDVPLSERRALRLRAWRWASFSSLTPLSQLPWDVCHVTPPLLGWPEHGFRAPWHGLALPAALVIALLCRFARLPPPAFTVGAWTLAPPAV